MHSEIFADCCVSVETHVERSYAMAQFGELADLVLGTINFLCKGIQDNAILFCQLWFESVELAAFDAFLLF